VNKVTTISLIAKNVDVVLRDQRVKPAMTKLDYVLVRNVILMRNVTNARADTLDTLTAKLATVINLELKIKCAML